MSNVDVAEAVMLVVGVLVLVAVVVGIVVGDRHQRQQQCLVVAQPALHVQGGTWPLPKFYNSGGAGGASTTGSATGATGSTGSTGAVG